MDRNNDSTTTIPDIQFAPQARSSSAVHVPRLSLTSTKTGDSGGIEAEEEPDDDAEGGTSEKSRDVEQGDDPRAAAQPGKPYSSFSEGHKWFIVTLATVGSISSPISSSIYAPAIPTLADAFRVSAEKINLTVTVYLIFQALTPAFWGAAADAYGRRPVFLATNAIFTLGCLGTALCPVDAYWLLMLMRIVQSSGASATIAVTSGLTADVAMPHERGRYIGLFHAASTFGPAVGPLLGGVLAGSLGWRAIFWFLVILGGVILVLVVLFLPETLRALVGDGSQTPPWLNRTPGGCIRRLKEKKTGTADKVVRKPVIYSPLASFRLLLRPALLLIFLWASFYYALFYAFLMIFSTLLDTQYHFSTTMIGVAYLASGIGAAIAGLSTGWIMDKLYRREKARRGYDHHDPERGADFPLERVRFAILLPQAVLLVLSALAMGWTMRYRVHVAVPIVVSFFFGIGNGFMTPVTLFALDLVPGQGSAVTASLNLCRCLFGAAGVAIVQPLNRAILSGWLFVLLVGICLLATPLPVIVVYYGPQWRRKSAKSS